MQELIISKIETWACTVPLNQTLDFGAFQINKRQHTVIRVSTADGLVAELIGQSRGAPIDVALLDVIAPLCLGKSALNLSQIHSHVVNSLNALEMDGTIGRAWSLMEICIHDLRAQAANWPLWQYLGGDPEPVKVMSIEGYALMGEDDQGFADRMVQRSEEGYQLIKMEAAHYDDEDELLNRLSLFRESLTQKTQLVPDFAWTWSDVKSKLSLLEQLQEYDIAWIEDPFHRWQLSKYCELRATSPFSIGCGDETTRAQDSINLLESEAVDILRLDATTVGGIESVRSIFASARAKEIPVSFHEHPEIHEHLVFGLGCSDHVEIFPLDRPFDKVHELWESTLFARIDKGYLHPSETPGTGIRLKPDMVAKFAVRSGKVEI
jgi:L-alanine-DL-glutamate epimerase-like enolase superfamily enzyme